MRMCVMGIIIQNDRTIAEKVNLLLSEYGEYIIGRMGIPNQEDKIYVISVILKGKLEIISALSGKLGKLPNVKVKSATADV